MLRISQESNRTRLSLDGGSFRKAARVSWGVRSHLPQGSRTQIAKKPGRIGAVALWPLVFVIAFVACVGVASAQNPPDGILAAPLGPSAVKVTVTACLYSTEDSCNAPLVIYRNPPGFTQSPVHTASLGEGTYGANSTEAIWMDTTVKGGTSYTYRVCTGAAISPAIMGPAYFREAAELIGAAAGGPPDRAKMTDVFRRHGMTVSGPPTK